MATAASVTTDWATCPICLDICDKPKSLPCIHGFCLKCLEGYLKNNLPGDEVPCPLCKKPFEIPAGGAGGLQHHFFIQHLVDTRNVFSESAEQVLCEVCVQERENNEDEISVATVYCIDCGEKLCNSCSQPHRRMNGGPHKVRPLGAELEQELIRLRRISCDKNADKKVELYCYDCDKNICLTCSAVKHRGHKSAEIAEVAKEFKSRIDDDGKQVLSGIKIIGEQSGKIKQTVFNFYKTVEGIAKKILEAGEAIKRKVDEQINECLEKLQSLKAESAKQAEINQEQLQLASVAMQSFHAYSREIFDKGRPSDITRAANELHERATELLGSDTTSVQYRPPKVTFTPADVTELIRSQLIGNVDVCKNSDKKVQDKGKPVYGVTFLDSMLYLLRTKPTQQIEVYNADSYDLERSVTVPGLQWMSDMIACAHNRCLYISGHYDKCIHKVGLQPDADATQWPVDDFASCLSLTGRHSILVSCPKVRKIKEFSSDGTLLREVQLPRDVVSLRHTISLSSGQFIICHGDANDEVHRVCKVDSKGRIRKSFGALRGSDSQRMNGPTHLAVDKNGFVFVADCQNCRVLLLSPDLAYVREVVSNDQLKGHPFGISLDVNRRQLYVAEGKCGTGRVIVVSI